MVQASGWMLLHSELPSVITKHTSAVRRMGIKLFFGNQAAFEALVGGTASMASSWRA